MKTLFAFLVVFTSHCANAMVISGPSAPVNLGGFDNTLDILDGADIDTDLSGSSVTISGFTHIINISGGIVQGDIRFSGFDHTFNVTGGMLLGDILGSGFNHVFNFSGFGLSLSGNNVTGRLLDGSPIDLNIDAGFNAAINLTNSTVPATSTIAMIALGLAGLWRSKHATALGPIPSANS